MQKKFNRVRNLPEIPQLETIETDGKRFYRSPSGLLLPSVTTVLGHSKKEGLKEWRDRIGDEEADKIMRRAGVRGTKWHTMIEKYMSGDASYKKDIMPDMRERFKFMKDELDKIDDILYAEIPLYSDILGIAGRTDLIAYYMGNCSIIDFKSSLRPKKEKWIETYFEQGSAYGIMFDETQKRMGFSAIKEPIKQMVIMISNDEEDRPQIFIKKIEDYKDSLLKKISTYYKEVINVS